MLLVTISFRFTSATLHSCEGYKCGADLVESEEGGLVEHESDGEEGDPCDGGDRAGGEGDTDCY